MLPQHVHDEPYDVPTVPMTLHHRVVHLPDGEHVYAHQLAEVRAEARHLMTMARVRNLIYLIASGIAALLLTRFLLLLFGAEPSSFAATIYRITDPIVRPLNGILGPGTAAGQGAVEFAALGGVALVFLIAVGLLQIIALLYTPEDEK